MARGNIRAAVSFVLIPVLVLQTACYRALGPPEPVHPEDNRQMATLRDAERVDVVLVDGSEYRLRRIVAGEYRLQGRDDETWRVTSFPWDSIQSVQAYEDATRQNAMMIGAMVSVAVVLVVLNNLPWESLGTRQ